MADANPVTREEMEEALSGYQEAIIEAVDAKFKDIEGHLMRIEESLDKTYGKILERHDGLLTKIARHLGLETGMD